jgi:general secretion pathway protein D
LLCAALTLDAQQSPGGFGGYRPGGSSYGRSGSSYSRSGSTSQQQYNPNGGVGSATISVDPDSRNITVIADEETMKTIAEVIKNLDKPRPQVLIKVVFLEVQHSKGSDIGIEGGWGNKISGTATGAFANAFGLSGLAASVTTNVNVFGQPLTSFLPMPPGAGLYQVLGKDFQVTLRAIAQAGKAQLLSRPSVIARDNQPASIVVGQSVPLITSVRYDNFGNAINSVTYTDVGIILKVTPYITGDGFVQMIVSPETSAIDPTTTVPISTGVNAPVINQRNADTVVITPDGQTVVIGGLMRNDRSDSENKIPLLGDIPLLGNLFKRKIKSDVKTELLIFLTPHIIQAPTQLAAVGDKERKQITIPDSDSERELNRFLDQIPMKEDEDAKKNRSNRK